METAVWVVIGAVGAVQLPLLLDLLDQVLPAPLQPGRRLQLQLSRLLALLLFALLAASLVFFFDAFLPLLPSAAAPPGRALHVVFALWLWVTTVGHFLQAALCDPGFLPRPSPEPTPAAGGDGGADKNGTASGDAAAASTTGEFEATLATGSSATATAPPSSAQHSPGASSTAAADRHLHELISGHARGRFGPGAAAVSSTHARNSTSALPPLPKPCRPCGGLVRPRLAGHCRTCGTCVEMMDHHCPFTMNCVGRYNFHHFFLFLCFGNAGVLYSLALSFQPFADCWLTLHTYTTQPQVCRDIGSTVSPPYPLLA